MTEKLDLNICDLIDIKWALKNDIKCFEDVDMTSAANGLCPLLEKIEAMIAADREQGPLRITLRGWDDEAVSKLAAR